MATYVLVHGAWGGSSVYNRMAAALRAQGHLVFSPSLTGQGDRLHLLNPGIDLSTHVRDVAAVIEGEDLQDVILCGHSYGGMVITGVSGACARRIRSLVYIDAFLPQAGQALWDIADEPARRHYIEAQKDRPGLIAPFPGADRDPSLNRHPLLTLLEPVKLDGSEAQIRNRTYVYATRGAPTIFTQFYDRVRQDPAWRVREADTGHMVMLEDHEGLLRILLEEAAR